MTGSEQMANGRREAPTQTEPGGAPLPTARTPVVPFSSRRGSGTGADTLTFKRVFERVEADTGLRLSNASIIRRVWDNQADYQADVLASIAAEEGLGEFDKTIQALARSSRVSTVSTAEARDGRCVRCAGSVGATNILMLLESPNWSLWIAVWSLATTDAVPRRRAAPSITRSGSGSHCSRATTASPARWEDAYRALARLLRA